MKSYDRPRLIIEYCLQPLGLDPTSAAYADAFHRLEHVIKTFQRAAARADQPVTVDFSTMPTLTINEGAHGQE